MFVISVSGAQASGKTTLARSLGRKLGAPVFSRDPLMAAIKDSGYPVDAPEDLQRLAHVGYRLQGVLIDQLLGQGHSVIVECVTAPMVRQQWRAIAERHAAKYVQVDTIVSDTALHRRRLEEREQSGKGGWMRIEWTTVEATLTALGPPSPESIVADGVRSVDKNVAAVVAALSR